METIGRYRLINKLGEGGMGVVYAAHDERLDRPVALKMIREARADDRARERLWREARSAASINHPNVCQLYEIGEDNGELFIAMELLEGESLAARLLKGPLPLAEAVQVTLSVLGALDALHRRSLVHRDLKPSNVFLTPHGVKILDFGLARPIEDGTSQTATGLTLPGTVVGTPEFMAPEQLLGERVDARTDLFAVGGLLFAMLSGKTPFAGDTVMKVLHAVMYEQPPALGGSPAIAAVDRVIRRALHKKPDERYQTSEAMAQELRGALLLADTGDAPRAQAMARLIVLPLRILRPDPETDFLAFSLPDAITSSLSGLESLVVRSSLAAARFSGDMPDLKAIATEADVDVVLVGTLMRAGSQLRVTTQLLEAPGGTVLWTLTSQAALGDLFQLQDEVARRIVESLSLPLTAREQRQLRHEVPGSAKAYEFYLRANQLANDSASWLVARDLYLQCLEEDPSYAPAWARVGRMHRVIGKFASTDPDADLAKADLALKRALELNPDLPIAHKFYAQLEVDLGRAKEAMLRLLKRAQNRQADPELFAGLVAPCRYCGLLEASVAAHDQARRLDASILTSVAHTFWMKGDYERALEEHPRTTDPVIGIVYAMMGREEQAIATLKADESRYAANTLRNFGTAVRALLEGHREESLESVQQLISNLRDPEAFFYISRTLTRLGETARALEMLARAVGGGFFNLPTLARDPWFDTLRANPEFMRILRQAETLHRDALAAFVECGGERVLGMTIR